MKLAKYLADYLDAEIDKTRKMGLPVDFTSEELQEVIEQGIDAFESTEQKQIKIIDVID